MKKLMIIFIGAGMTLVSCKTHLDSLAANTGDDVYYNPGKDRKANVAPQPVQYDPQQQQQGYNSNYAKKGATAADQNNPYYKDPNFNYDDYYDNAYAARVKRFQQPIYGTSYYDSYYTNSYFYNQNPSMYGNSIYNSYNVSSSYGYGSSNYYPGQGYGSGYGGYYSPSAAFNNYAYNPYYSGYSGYGGYGNSMSMGMGYGMGCGSSMSMGMGYGSPYGGMGYNPYGMMGYGSPYGMGYGSGMGYGGYNSYNSPMYSSGYYNSYDYNSGTYHYGPRGTHSGGNSATNSPMPAPHHMEVKNPGDLNSITNAGVSPSSSQRFSQVVIPKENYAMMVEAKNPPAVNTSHFQPNGNTGSGQNQGQSNPVRYNPFYNSGGSNGGNTNYSGGNGTSVQPINNGYVTPRGNGNTYNVQEGTPVSEPKPHKWFSNSNWGGDNNGGTYNNNNANGATAPSMNHNFGGGNSGGSWGGGGSSGGSSGGGGGGVSRPRR
jgi:hypothetical protein